MKFVLLKYCVVISLVVVSGSLLMDVSHQVQVVEGDIKAQKRSIVREEEAVRVLKAEWAYLNDPARLERLVSGSVGLYAPNASDIISEVGVIPDTDKNVDIFVPAQSPLYREISSSSYMPVQVKSSQYKIHLSTSHQDDGGAH